jgi:catechol 2,3-dioxygenase
LLETGERVRFELPSGHLIELYAEKSCIGNGIPEVNPAPWNAAREHGIAPIQLDHCLLYGPNIAQVQKIFTEVLGFYLVERVLSPEGDGDVGIWLSCSHKVHDIAFVEYPEPGKLHHCSFLLESWEQVLRAGDIMSMNEVNVDIGPTRHGVTRGCTIYAWDPPVTASKPFGRLPPLSGLPAAVLDLRQLRPGPDYPQRKLHESFLTVVT